MTGASKPVILIPDTASIEQAAEVLREGGLVAVPTETVYGLAARADSEDAVQTIYRAKGRPSFNPLIVHVADLDGAAAIAHLDDRAERLAQVFWPGALTLVLPIRADAGIAPSVTAGLDTIALRCPAHPAMRALLEESSFPLAAPSANRSGAVSPTTADHVRGSLGDAVDCIIDGGACPVGLESTIVALRRDGGWQILRPGPISEAEIAAVVGQPADCGTLSDAIEAPGQLVSHYSPGKPLRLDVTAAEQNEFHIGFGPVTGDASLSLSGDLSEAASRLYALLHQAAASEHSAIAVAPIPPEGIGAAIRDRLKRAAV